MAKALDLEFYIGPKREGGSASHPLATLPVPLTKALGLPEDASADDAIKAVEDRLKDAGRLDAATLKDEVADVVEEKTEALRAEMAAMRTELMDASALARPVNEDASSDETRPLEVHGLAAAAGGGAVDIDNAPVVGRLWFNAAWLNKRGLDPKRCAVIGVKGESMEPTLPDGCSILVDRARTDWRPETILVMRTGDGLVVKRTGEDADGNRLLLSDHPAWAPARLPIDAEVIGRVVWTGRDLA